jgi:hypothetical protein
MLPWNNVTRINSDPVKLRNIPTSYPAGLIAFSNPIPEYGELNVSQKSLCKGTKPRQ